MPTGEGTIIPAPADITRKDLTSEQVAFLRQSFAAEAADQGLIASFTETPQANGETTLVIHFARITHAPLSLTAAAPGKLDHTAPPTPSAGGPLSGTAASATGAPIAQLGAVTNNSILGDFHGNGASAKTAAQDHLPPGVEASRGMARTDLVRVTALKDRFNAAAALNGLPPALLAAIASRESRCGNVLQSDGTGDGGNAFGIMQVDLRFHTIAGRPDPKSQAHINQASGILKDGLTAMVKKFPAAAPARQLQAAVAAYNCGANGVATPDTADAATTGHDYSNDVWERARFYATGW